MCSRKVALTPSIQLLVEAILEHGHLTSSSARELLIDSEITPEDLSPWADFGHQPEDSYGRHLIYDGGFFELMAMSWTDGDMAAIHDHGNTQWGAVKLFGRVEHAVFQLDGGRLSTADRRTFEPGTVLSVNHDMIHQMGNVGQPDYLTLHLYGCYDRDGDVTGDARLFALDEGKIQITSGGVFYGLPEECISRRVEAPSPDFPTLLRDRIELLARLLRARGAFGAPNLETTREQRLADWLFAADTWRGASEELLALISGVAGERTGAILHQELRAAGRLQLRLIDADLAPASWAKSRDDLARALAQPGLEHSGNAYLAVASTSLNVNLPMALTA